MLALVSTLEQELTYALEHVSASQYVSISALAQVCLWALKSG